MDLAVAPPESDEPTVRRPSVASWLKVARELTFVAIFLYLYELIRENVVQSGSVALQHALSVVRLEEALGIFRERALQAPFLHAHGLVRVFNLYYGGTHFLVPAGALIWLALRQPDRYARARTSLAVTTAAAFVFFWLCPVAPPRLLPARFGIVDTIRHLGGGHAVSVLIDRAGDAYAAMPSLHMAWAVWCTIVLYPVARHRVSRVLLVLYPLATALVVMTTGNHFILDAVAGAVLVGAVCWVLDRLPALWAWVRSGDVAAGRPLPAGRPSDP